VRLSFRAGLALATACLTTLGCSPDPDLDGLEEIGTTESGATIYATRLPDGRIDVRVVGDGDLWCNASGPSGTTAPIAVCDGSVPAGTVFMAPVAKRTETPDLCVVQTGLPVPGERVATPDDWDFDFVLSLSSEADAFVSPCSRLTG
jgi:hypothetical protein